MPRPSMVGWDCRSFAGCGHVLPIPLVAGPVQVSGIEEARHLVVNDIRSTVGHPDLQLEVCLIGQPHEARVPPSETGAAGVRCLQA